MAVHVVRLRGPKENDGEKVGAGDEGDDERHGEDPPVLPQTTGKHGIFGTPHFPGHEGKEQENPEEQGHQHMCGVPLILSESARSPSPSRDEVYLVSSPRQTLGLPVSYVPLQAPHSALTCDEQDHAGYTEEAPDVINLADDFFPGQTEGVHPRRGMIEKAGQDESRGRPGATESPDISPSGVSRNQLTPEHGGAERYDGEHQNGDINPSFPGGRQLGGHGERGEFVDPGTHPRQGHATCHGRLAPDVDVGGAAYR